MRASARVAREAAALAKLEEEMRRRGDWVEEEEEGRRGHLGMRVQGTPA